MQNSNFWFGFGCAPLQSTVLVTTTRPPVESWFLTVCRQVVPSQLPELAGKVPMPWMPYHPVGSPASDTVYDSPSGTHRPLLSSAGGIWFW